MSEPRRILLAEDESTLRLAVATALRREAYEVVAAEDGETAWAAWLDAERAASPFDLLLLDISMPRLDGRELLGRVRARDRSVPAMFVTSRDEEFDRVLGLDLGADDYLCKPFSLKELLARVRALLRRAEAARSSPLSGPAQAQGALLALPGAASRPDGRLAAGAQVSAGQAEGPGACGQVEVAAAGLRLDPERFEARLGAAPLKLTLTEFRILECFLRAPGVVRSREVLVAAAYPEETYLSDRAVDCHIKRIRRKLEEAGGGPDFIETVYGLGYRLAERA